jgi:hypothetical protein
MRMIVPGRLRRAVLAAGCGLVVLLAAPIAATSAAGPVVEVWKSAYCGCCGGWIAHLRQAGFTVVSHDSEDMVAVKTANGVTDTLASCHTARVGGYVVEGHVPAADIARLLAERPPITGLAAPGMPAGAPGMDGPAEPYVVVSFDAAGRTTVFARH